MLTVLVAYFERDTTVQAVCNYYGIAISTLYAWKHRLLEHKDLLLGMLASRKEPAQAFLRSLLNSIRISDQLSDFFFHYAFSFMQNQSAATTHSQPP
jgi:transposase-like protein